MQKKSSRSDLKFKEGKANRPQRHVFETSYVSKQVETSIALLDSPEDPLVIEALVYLSEYADIQENNLIYLYQLGLLKKLLNLIHRGTHVLVLVLRFLGILLTIEKVILEMDQDIHTDTILEISHIYTSRKDPNIIQFCLSILSKLTESCRITCLIFKKELFKPIFDTLKKTTEADVLQWTLELLSKLVNAPTAPNVLPEIHEFDISVLIHHLDNPKKKIVQLSFEIIRKLTSYGLNVFQNMFKKAKLIEIMLENVMSDENKDHHITALEIISNSMKSEQTSSYFMETLEFLKFCQWVKTCDKEYLFPCILILEHLTKIPSRRQMLFDLSVEHSILSFLRSTEKRVVDKTCDAISNMMTHKYCCEEMLKSDVLKHLLHIVVKKDGEDCGREMALKTILDFSRRNLNTLDIIHKLGAHKVLLGYFKKDEDVSEVNFLGVLEILYKMSMSPQLQQDLVHSSFFEKLLHLFQTAPANTAALACEIMANFLSYQDFRRIYLASNGPQLFVAKLQNCKDMKLLKIILLFIHSSLIYTDIVDVLQQNNLVKALKTFPEHFKVKMPIVNKIINLIYKIDLPLKFFETNRLEITDKLRNKFYLIHGKWQAPFPVFKELEESPVSTVYTIYVVDYSFEAMRFGCETENSMVSESMSPARVPSERSISTLSRVASSFSSFIRRGPFHINYGKLTSDPFLPRYILHASKYIVQANTMASKVRSLAKYVDVMMCESIEGYTMLEKAHDFKLHVQMLKHKLGNNMIPIGFLRLGRHCERALLFKAMADKCCVPASLVKGKASLYWNEVVLCDPEPSHGTLKLYVVDLMNNIGDLLVVGSRAANQYCDLTA